MDNQALEVLPTHPETRTQLAIFRDGLSEAFASYTDEELIKIACNADARKAPIFRSLITLNLVEI